MNNEKNAELTRDGGQQNAERKGDWGMNYKLKMTDEQIIESLKAKLKEAIELAEAAAKTSPYQQTPHFWKRIYDLKHGTNNSK